MTQSLYYKTVTPLLLKILKELMALPELNDFRLVGGTSLSLQIGHRLSVDIDLFTDVPYQSVDFKAIHELLNSKFAYVETDGHELTGPGKTYFIGETNKEIVKLDLYYTDLFIREINVVDGLRLASVEEIIAMKMDVIQRGGRKKDFWDLHDLIDDYSLQQMLSLHLERYPFSHDEQLLIANLTNFENADHDFEPNCLKGKYWEIIKLDFLDFVSA